MFRDEHSVYMSDTEDTLFSNSKSNKFQRMEKGTVDSKKIKKRLEHLEKTVSIFENYLKNPRKKDTLIDLFLKKDNLLEAEDEEIKAYIRKRLDDLKEDIQIYTWLLEDELKKCPQHKPLKRKIKKRTNVQVKTEVLKIIEKIMADDSLRKCLTKEDVARYLQVKECQVEQVFMELNREGILSQPVHHAPHDSQRDPWGFYGNNWWMSDLYYIREKKNAE